MTYYTYNGQHFLCIDGLYYKVSKDSVIVDSQQQPDVELLEEPKVELINLGDKAPFPPYPLPVPALAIDVRKKNELNVAKIINTTLLTFDIKIIRVSPFCCCAIDIVINTTVGQVERTVNLTAEDYAKWGSDDNYVFHYIQDNIEKIY
jgi:hypothetical protein